MALISAEVLAKSAGDLLLAPFPQAAPAVADLDDLDTLTGAGWVHTGWLSEEGPTMEGFEGESSKLYGWNAIPPIRSITRVTEPMVPVNLLQWNVESLSLFFADADYNAGDQVLTIPESGVPVESSLLLRVIDGDRHIGIWVAKVTPRGNGSFEFPGDGLAPIPVVFDVLSTGDPESYLKVIGIDTAGSDS